MGCFQCESSHRDFLWNSWITGARLFSEWVNVVAVDQIVLGRGTNQGSVLTPQTPLTTCANDLLYLVGFSLDRINSVPPFTPLIDAPAGHFLAYRNVSTLSQYQGEANQGAALAWMMHLIAFKTTACVSPPQLCPAGSTSCACSSKECTVLGGLDIAPANPPLFVASNFTVHVQGNLTFSTAQSQLDVSIFPLQAIPPTLLSVSAQAFLDGNVRIRVGGAGEFPASFGLLNASSSVVGAFRSITAVSTDPCLNVAATQQHGNGGTTVLLSATRTLQCPSPSSSSPSSPPLALIIGVSVGGAVVLGVAIALLVHLLQKRSRSVRTIEMRKQLISDSANTAYHRL